MFDIAAQVLQWQREGRPVSVGRLVAGHGLAGREAAPVAAWTPGAPPVGSPVAARAAAQIVDTDPAAAVVVPVLIDESAAAAEGLACGGHAQIMVQPATDFPASVWSGLRAGEPLGVVDPLTGDDVAAGSTTTFGATDVPERFARIFGRGVSALSRVDDVLLTTYWPRSRLLVVGDGLVADALVAQAGLLGWAATVVNDVAAATEILGGYGRADAVVVLSHDRDVDGPVLAAAVASPTGYVGALGSKGTQAARRAWFAEHDVGGTQRIRGPAGLAIGGYGPAEIALSIVAEVVAARSGSVPARC